MTTTTLYVTRTDFNAQVAKQDSKTDKLGDKLETLRDEFHTFRDEMIVFRHEMYVFRDEVNERFDRIEKDLVEVKDNIKYLQFEQKRSAAFFRNQLKKIPTLRFEPVPIWHPTQGTLMPNNDLFPRNAKEFFNLRHPTTPRACLMLHCLVRFYDVPIPKRSDSGSGDDDDDGYIDDTDSGETTEMGVDDVRKAMDDDYIAMVVMDALETRLGLVEEHFNTFLQRARSFEQASQQQQQQSQRRQREVSDSLQGSGDGRQDISSKRQHVPELRGSSEASGNPDAESSRFSQLSIPSRMRVSPNLSFDSAAARDLVRKSDAPSPTDGNPGSARTN